MAHYITDYVLDNFAETTVEDLEIPEEAVPGDAIKYAAYRDTGTYFLGWDGKLIEIRTYPVVATSPFPWK